MEVAGARLLAYTEIHYFWVLIVKHSTISLVAILVYYKKLLSS